MAVETAAAPDLTDPEVAADIEPMPLFLQAPIEALEILAAY